ncbi:MAG: amidohydrolase [Chloroflexi bacterium]|nr:MAG: amidohydrolase [Chloroflexota bacterium]TMF35545.1 MAG: amidohydrolase [Chloroflexota bacterium]
MVIDSETHVIFRAWPIETNPTRTRVERFTWHEHSGDLLADEMARAGVDRSILISYDGYDVEWFLRSVGSTPEDFITGKKYTKLALARHPDRFYWFSTLKDPRVMANVDAVKQDFQEGAIGLKIFPSFLVMAVDDPALIMIYRLCVENDRRVILSFEDAHPPETPSIPEFFEQFDRVMAEVPELRVQLNHAGCIDPLRPDAEVVFRTVPKHANVWVSTAAMGLIWDDGTEYPFPNYLARLERLRDALGADRLLWGTDWPHFSHYMLYPQAIDSVRKHANFFSASEKALFLGGNAERFLRVP